MKLAYSFFSGLVLGAVLMLVFLGEKGRLTQPPDASASLAAPSRVPSVKRQVTAPGEETHAEEEPVRTRAEPRTPARPIGGAALLIPVEGVEASALTPMFNDKRSGGRAHEAIDIMAPRGRPVRAVAGGTVRKLFLSRAGGITLYQESRDRKLMYYYAHLDSYADGIREGSVVRRGQLLGYVGSSGNANPDAPHLHFAIFQLPATREWWKGEPIDPYPYLVGTP